MKNDQNRRRKAAGFLQIAKAAGGLALDMTLLGMDVADSRVDQIGRDLDHVRAMATAMARNLSDPAHPLGQDATPRPLFDRPHKPTDIIRGYPTVPGKPAEASPDVVSASSFDESEENSPFKNYLVSGDKGNPLYVINARTLNQAQAYTRRNHPADWDGRVEEITDGQWMKLPRWLTTIHYKGPLLDEALGVPVEHVGPPPPAEAKAKKPRRKPRPRTRTWTVRDMTRDTTLGTVEAPSSAAALTVAAERWPGLLQLAIERSEAAHAPH